MFNSHIICSISHPFFHKFSYICLHFVNYLLLTVITFYCLSSISVSVKDLTSISSSGVGRFSSLLILQPFAKKTNLNVSTLNPEQEQSQV